MASNDGRDGQQIAYPFYSSSVGYQSGNQGIVTNSSYSYWSALLSAVSSLRTLVPVFNHPKVPASWPIVKQKGAYLVKIQPFEVTDSMNRALVQVVNVLRLSGGLLGKWFQCLRKRK